ncbi:MAG: arginine--tRNA ligase [Candidatus Paceibacterota bacterium]
MINFIKNIFSQKNEDFYFSFLKDLETVTEKDVTLNIPPSHIEADFALMTNNPKINKYLSNKIKDSKNKYIDEVKAAGPFINLFLNKKTFYNKTLKNIIARENSYGNNKINKKLFIEYSSPNIAKPLGIGHLRSTVIGEALAKIHEKQGYRVFRENYLGDWGTQFGKLVYAYKEWGNDEEIKKNPTKELKNLYVRFQKESEKDKSIEDNAREFLNKLENGDKELMKLWESFREPSVVGFKKTYTRLGIKFDRFSGESEYVKQSLDLINECEKRGLCEKGEGKSLIVELDGLPSFLLRKKDGSTLYLTRDLAALKDRIKNHNPDKILYIVGNEQKLHFRQLFALAEKLKIIEDHNVEHVGYGLILSNGKKMSTRKGTTVMLSEIFNESVSKSKKIIEEKSPELLKEEKKEISEILGVGSVVYNDLRHDREKDINFDWDKVLSFEGGSAVYLQYTYARIMSIINKVSNDSIPHKLTFENDLEFDLAKQLFIFPKILNISCENEEPHKICSYLEDLAQSFNSFYGNTSIINTENSNLKLSRIQLAKQVSVVIKEGLRILGIAVPNKM